MKSVGVKPSASLTTDESTTSDCPTTSNLTLVDVIQPVASVTGDESTASTASKPNSVDNKPPAAYAITNMERLVEPLNDATPMSNDPAYYSQKKLSAQDIAVIMTAGPCRPQINFIFPKVMEDVFKQLGSGKPFQMKLMKP